jgi:hypothetical protein
MLSSDSVYATLLYLRAPLDTLLPGGWHCAVLAYHCTSVHELCRSSHTRDVFPLYVQGGRA